MASSRPVRLRSKWLFDGASSSVLADAACLVRDGRIVAVGSNADVPAPEDVASVDLGDATLLPGLIDAHMHTFGLPSTGLHALPFERESYRALRAAGELRRLLYAGFTAARCLGSSVGPDLRRAIEEGHVEGPRLMAAGEFISSTSGTWDSAPTPLSWARERGMVADGPDEVRRAVRERVRAGSDFIKLGLSKGGVHDRYHAWGDDPYRQPATYSLAEVRAGVEEAHANGLRVSAHCIGDAAVRLALDGDVDVLEHGYAINDETRQRLAASGKIVVTTFAQVHFHRQAYKPFHYPQWERDVYERHWAAITRDFRLSREAGVRYALGTDLIGEPTHPLDGAAKEFELAVELGMSAIEALQAGTKIASEVLGLQADIGTLETGKYADVIAVEGNVTKDVRTLRRPIFLLKGGDVLLLAGGEDRKIGGRPTSGGAKSRANPFAGEFIEIADRSEIFLEWPEASIRPSTISKFSR
jgi:imidazolonepropionase-like amidohydrolase